MLQGSYLNHISSSDPSRQSTDCGPLGQTAFSSKCYQTVTLALPGGGMSPLAVSPCHTPDILSTQKCRFLLAERLAFMCHRRKTYAPRLNPVSLHMPTL